MLAYVAIPQVHDFVTNVVACFASGDFSKMKEFIATYGVTAAAVSFFLMIFQSIIAPLPAFVLIVTNANLFGWWQGAPPHEPAQWPAPLKIPIRTLWKPQNEFNLTLKVISHGFQFHLYKRHSDPEATVA